MEKIIGKKSMNEPIASAVRQTMAGDNPIIQVLNMSKWYGEFNMLRNINLEVRRKERIVICGPSGSVYR